MQGVSPDTQEVEDVGGLGQAWRMTLSLPHEGLPIRGDLMTPHQSLNGRGPWDSLGQEFHRNACHPVFFQRGSVWKGRGQRAGLAGLSHVRGRGSLPRQPELSTGQSELLPKQFSCHGTSPSSF